LDSLGLARLCKGERSLSQLVYVMHEVEIQDGVIQVDASIIGPDLGLEPFEVSGSRASENSLLRRIISC
jgi:hypothetical protein